MILKKLISVMSVFAIIVSSFTTAVVSADEEMTPIACTQSASYLTEYQIKFLGRSGRS